MTPDAQPSVSPPRFVTDERDLIEERLKMALSGNVTAMAAAARYVMGWEEGAKPAGGKRIRPALCLFGAKAFGAHQEEAMPGAIAVELLHNFSLVHDEIQDRDETRHNRPTIWTVVGDAQAINVGNYLYTRSIGSLAECTAEPERKVAAIELLMSATSAMLEGQWADISFESEAFVSAPDYLRMVEGKTGALLGASVAIGAVLGGAGADDVELLRRWGVKLGLAFQARDDYLGIWGDANVTGKPVGNDVARKKKSLPIVYGLAKVGTSAVIRDAFQSEAPSSEQVDRVVASLELGGVDQKCLDETAAYAEEASKLLDDVSLNDEAREGFQQLTDYFVGRTA